MTNSITVTSDTLRKAFLAIVIAVALLFFVVLISSNKKPVAQSQATLTGDTQTIELTAKGGYSPALINAKPNIKTILKVETNNTFDCSTAFTIPSLNIRKNLPSNGVTEIEIPPQKLGSDLTGTCSMGMYSFKMKFN